MSWIVDGLNAEVNSPSTYSADREEALLGFIATPFHAEQVLSFGTLLALDSFLSTLTILPLRSLYALYKRKWTVDCTQLLIIACAYRVLQGVNTSQVYHSIRGQAGITMVVLYSLVEVCDKFLCSVGHEIASCATSERTQRSPKRLVVYSLLNFLYLIAHSFVLMWQLVTLNLAVNSYSNALLSFMLTSQFGEIKSAVFKKFDKDSLFQLTCTDIAQRFQYVSLLLVIVLRNFFDIWFNDRIESKWTLQILSAIGGPALLIIITVIIVDWLKIAYIINFNNLESKNLYSQFWGILRNEYQANSQHGPQSLVSKQAGLPVSTLVLVCVRMFFKGGVIASPVTPLLFLSLLVVKLYLSKWLQQITKQSVGKEASTLKNTRKQM